MIKVLFTTNIPSPYRVEFFNELSKYVDLTVLYFWEKGLYNHAWEIDSVKHNYSYTILKELKVGHIRFNPQVINFLKNQDFDVHIIGGYSLVSEMISILYLKAKKVPFLLNSDGGFIKKDITVLEWYKRFLIGSASGWLASGANCSATLVHYGADINKVTEYCFSSVRDNDVISKPLNINEKMNLRRSIGLPETKKIILTVGQFIHRKGIDIILECAKNDTSGSIYVVIGRGPLRSDYEQYIRENKVHNVIILDFMLSDELKKYYMASDIFVLPTREDIWGLVINEAIANGLPVIATERTGSAHDLIAENGKVISPTPQNLAEAIDTLTSDEEGLYHLAEKSLVIARSYTIENMARIHFEAIKNFRKLKMLHKKPDKVCVW